MKKLYWLCFTLVCSLLFGMTAQADVIWGPRIDLDEPGTKWILVAVVVVIVVTIVLLVKNYKNKKKK